MSELFQRPHLARNPGLCSLHTYLRCIENGCLEIADDKLQRQHAAYVRAIDIHCHDAMSQSRLPLTHIEVEASY